MSLQLAYVAIYPKYCQVFLLGRTSDCQLGLDLFEHVHLSGMSRSRFQKICHLKGEHLSEVFGTSTGLPGSPRKKADFSYEGIN